MITKVKVWDTAYEDPDTGETRAKARWVPAEDFFSAFGGNFLKARVKALEERIRTLEGLNRMETAKAKLDDRKPPEEISDLIEWSSSPKEDHDKLIAKHTEAKHREEMAREYGDKTEMMLWLSKAERLETGIRWNRNRAAEQI